MSTLHLVLKGKWFDMIASGEKKEEYREIKPYWERRFSCSYIEKLISRPCSSIYKSMNIYNVGCSRDTITFRRGYFKNAPEMTVEFKCIITGKAKPEWSDNWKGDVFIIKLGDILCKKNF